MKGYRTEREDGYEGAQNGMVRQLRRNTEMTGKTAMKRHRTDWGTERTGKTAMKGKRTDW